MIRSSTDPRYALCVCNESCEDLEVRKVYQVLPDTRAARDGYVRIVDDSGDDYLYPESYFVHLKLPEKARRAVTATRQVPGRQRSGKP